MSRDSWVKWPLLGVASASTWLEYKPKAIEAVVKNIVTLQNCELKSDKKEDRGTKTGLPDAQCINLIPTWMREAESLAAADVYRADRIRFTE